MGWFFLNRMHSVDELVRELTKPVRRANGSYALTTLAHQVEREGDYQVLWAVEHRIYPFGNFESGYPDGQNHKIILCVLMDSHNGSWGYKAMSELDHPYYYSCPLRFFDLADDFICEEWRKKVRAYHRLRSAA